jgi:predicted metal-binding transcription factor (methanogenesis marker protein 9)
MMIWDIPRQRQIQKTQKVENLENHQNPTNQLKICCPPPKNAKSAWHKQLDMYIMEQQRVIHVKHFFADRFNWAQHLNTPVKPKEIV